TWRNQVDSAGFFYLAVPSKRVTSGKPLRLAARSNGKGSLRWFALPPVTDAVSLQRAVAIGLSGDAPPATENRK
ncbi:MAG: hypothetical protein WD468_04960, partial [Pirellulales bacterium]